jgi:PAS domain S-box-containing protein
MLSDLSCVPSTTDVAAAPEFFLPDGMALVSPDRVSMVLHEQCQRVPLLNDDRDLVAVCDFNGFLLHLNAAGRIMLGLGLNDNLSLFQVRCFSLLTQGRWDEIFSGLMSTGSWSGVDTLQYAKSKPIAAQMIILAHGTPDGEVDCFSIVARNSQALISPAEQQQQQRLIADREAQLAAIVENINDVLYMMSPEGKFLYLSPQFEVVMGYPVKEWLGRSPVELTHPDEIEMLGNHIFQQMTTGQGGQLETRSRHRDGHYLWLAASNTVVRNEAGVTLGIQGSLRDITDRKQAEAALKASEEQFQNITANAPGAIYRYLIRPDGTDEFVYMNQGWQELFEIDPVAAIADTQLVWQRIHPEDMVKLQQDLAQIAQSAQSRSFEFRLLMPDGRIKWVQSQSRSLRSQLNEVILDGFMLDATQRKTAEAELQSKTGQLKQALGDLQRTQAQLVQTEKMSALGQLVAGVAHEINNPVNFIYGNLKYTSEYIQDLIRLLTQYREAYPVPAPAIQTTIADIDLDYLMADLPKILSSMKVGADRIREIVLSLRNFSRLDEAEYKEADLHLGIDSTLMILQNRIKDCDDRPEIKIHKNYGNLPLVACFAGQLNQVYMNLLANAIDALEEGFHGGQVSQPEIWIQTDIVDGQAVVRFTDNGVGIPAAIQASLFDPFFTTKPVGKGTGMGLSISYQIITEKHCGKLICESAIGQGTTFEIQIPLKQDIQD